MDYSLSEIRTRAEPFEPAPAERRAWTRWPKWILLLLVLAWLVNLGISLLIQHSRLERMLTARLEAAFGRPVEVGSYSFRLWTGPTLEAHSITVAEDPRFGHEYFLRAESLTVRLRLLSLLRGRLELGTLWLTRPSLNLVRSQDGQWNLAEWLPRPAGSPAAEVPVRIGRIEVSAGRINFKRGDEKLPFAFVSVKGYAEPEGSGRWRIDLEADPSRAATIVQQAGTLHLVGDVGGTSSRLRPAELNLSWTNASISDVLRLVRSYDYGLRGTLALAVSAHTEGDNWLLEGRAELRQMHRWNLALRPENPALNLLAKGRLIPGSSRLDLSEAVLEAPRSNARASGAILWGPNGKATGNGSSATLVQIVSSGIELSDLFAWFRAFHAEVADGLALQGLARLEMIVRGWPPRIDQGTLMMDGAELAGNPLRVPVRLGPLALGYDARGISLSPALLSFDSPGSSLHIVAFSKAGRNASSSLQVTGNIAQVRDLVATASALGWNISRGWDLGGPLRCNLRWQGARYPWDAQPVGTMEWGDRPEGATLRAPFLNQPITQIRGRADWNPGARRITLNSAQAFGARWSGSFDRLGPAREWRFSLSADRLAAADLDRWLNPRWRESLLDRMFPFLNLRSSSNVTPENLHANGRISLEQFTLSPLIVRHLQGDLKIEGRHLALANAKAQFYGGNIGGSLDTKLEALPSYRTTLNFSQVDLYALAAAAPGIANLFAGSASGEISLSARGADSAGLLASLECQGTARVNDAELRNLNLLESLGRAARRPGTSSFREVSAAFTCGDRRLQFQNLLLLGAGAELDASGSLDFSQHLDFRMRVLTGDAARGNAKASDATEPVYQITGTLSAPQIARNSIAVRRP